MSGLVIFAWAFAIVAGLVLAVQRSHERDRAARDLQFRHDTRRLRAARRRAEVERWNRRSIAVAGEFDA